MNSIELADIDEELLRLWDSELGKKKIRSSLFTCILYVQKGGLFCSEDKAEFYQKIIKSVVGKFPCRVIMILCDTDPQKNYLKTSVSSETIGASDQQIFCEIIHIEAAGSLVERVPFIILPHILPDLPVYLVWTQDPSTESKILPYLERFADRVIFDSESVSDLRSYSRSVRSLMERFHCAIGDLNWSALSSWRTILAQLFDNKETFMTLSQSTTIRIRYNATQTPFQKHTEIESAYLQAWLCSRMNWKFLAIESQEGNIRLRYRRPLSEIAILLVPKQDPAEPPGSILALDIESAKNGGSYCIEKHPKTRQVIVQYSEKEFCQLPCSMFLGGSAAGEEIIEEIFYPTGGAHYKEMLEVLTQIPWRL